MGAFCVLNANAKSQTRKSIFYGGVRTIYSRRARGSERNFVKKLRRARNCICRVKPREKHLIRARFGSHTREKHANLSCQLGPMMMIYDFLEAR